MSHSINGNLNSLPRCRMRLREKEAYSKVHDSRSSKLAVMRAAQAREGRAERSELALGPSCIAKKH